MKDLRTHIKEFQQLGASLYYNGGYVGGDLDKTYQAKDLNKLRTALHGLKEFDIVREEAEWLLNSPIGKSRSDDLLISSPDDTVYRTRINELKFGIPLIAKYIIQNLSEDESAISITLPDMKSFDELSKYASDLKKSIEIIVEDPRIGGEVKIIAGEKGSLVLIISVGIISAVRLIAYICNSAAVVKRKNAEVDLVKQHVRTLELKNDAIETVVEAQKQLIQKVITNEAEAICQKEFGAIDTETVSKLKLSIGIISDLIEKGTKILPVSSKDNAEIRNQFPDYSALNLVESAIKQIKGSNE